MFWIWSSNNFFLMSLFGESNARSSACFVNSCTFFIIREHRRNFSGRQNFQPLTVWLAIFIEKNLFIRWIATVNKICSIFPRRNFSWFLIVGWNDVAYLARDLITCSYVNEHQSWRDGRNCHAEIELKCFLKISYLTSDSNAALGNVSAFSCQITSHLSLIECITLE